MADGLGLKMGILFTHLVSLTGDIQLREQKPETPAMRKNPVSKDPNMQEGEFPAATGRLLGLRGLPPRAVLLIENY